MMGMWGEINKGIQQVGATGMGLLKEQNDEKYRQAQVADSQARLNIAQEEANRNKLQFENSEKKRLEQEARRKAFIPASLVAPNIMNLPKSKARYLDALKMGGYQVKEDGDEVYIQGEGLEYLQTLRTTNRQFQKDNSQDILDDLKNNNMALSQQIAELRGSGKTDDDKTLAPLLAKQKEIKLQTASIYSLQEDFIKEEKKQEQAKELKQMEIDAKTEKNPTEASLAVLAATGDQDAIKALEFLKGQKKAGATSISISNKVGQESMTKLGEEMSKDLVSQRKDVAGAVSSLNNIKEAEKLISSGIITGTGAEYLVNMGNFLSSRLGVNLAKNPVDNTQAYTATMGNQVGQIIKQFGSGTGLSDADREYAEKIVGGKITVTEGAIKKLIAINKKAFTNVVKNYNKQAEQAMKKPGADQLPYDLRIEYDFGKEVSEKPGGSSPYSKMSNAELLKELGK